MNKRVLSIKPSATLGLAAKAKELAAQGKQVCSFAAGEPDFDTLEPIKKAAIEALQRGETKYAPAAGIMPLRKAIADKLQRENGLTYKPEQIVVSGGAKSSLFNLFMAICDEGDEVIIPSPFWLSYPEMVRVPGGVPVFVEGKEANGLKITPEQLEAAITPRSRALIINSPSNPTGCVYSEEELRALADIAVKHDLLIVSDEIYEKLIYDGLHHVSVASLSEAVFERTITVNGFSKAFSMTGWRLGYLAGPTSIVKATIALQSHSTSGTVTFAQFGGIEALNGHEEAVREMREAFCERRDYLHERLTGMEGIRCVKPLGAFYMMPNISSLGMPSAQFAERLLSEQAVVVVPGGAFGADTHVRLSYACSMDVIREGMDRLEKFIASL